jgi:RHS repeat-associated protein
MAYDKNGNITNLTRKGHVVDNPVSTNSADFGVMDILTYSYQTGSNKLLKVADAASVDKYGFKDDAVNTSADTANDFTYDANGNMLSDANKGITAIEYNHLNMPTKITVAGANAGVLDYKYSADGIKLQKKKTVGANVTTTDYAGDFVYENNVLKQFSHPEGYVEPDGSGWQYVYRLTDIWGNTRITFADDNNDGSVNSSEIRREQNYYPFGLEHQGYNGSMYGAKNNLKTYQKQEFTEDLGLNTHEWKYRVSDPAIGRFWQIDPLAEDYVYNSTYAFQENKLGMGVELEGLEMAKFDTPMYDPNLRNLSPTEMATVRGHQVDALVNGTILVGAVISPIPGDETFVAGLLFKTGAAALDVASQVAAGGDVDLVGPAMNFAPLGPLTKEGVDALIDVGTDGTVRTPFGSTNGESKSTTEVVIDFAIGVGSNSAQANIPKEVTNSAVGNVIKEGVVNAAENISGEVIKKQTANDEDKR